MTPSRAAGYAAVKLSHPTGRKPCPQLPPAPAAMDIASKGQLLQIVHNFSTQGSVPKYDRETHKKTTNAHTEKTPANTTVLHT